MSEPKHESSLPSHVWSGYALASALIFWQLYVAGPDGVADGATLVKYGARKPNFGFPQAPWRLLASMFLHGGWFHAATNALLVALWGNQLARVLGALPMLVTFLLCGIWGSLASDVYGPEGIAIGASGGTAGFVLALLVLAFLAPQRSGWAGDASSWLRVSAIVVLLNVVMAFGLTGIAGGVLDHWAHLGGALGGVVLAISASRDVERTRWYWAGAVLLVVGAAAVIWYRGPSPLGT